jgi:2'-5' RNA ligase
MRAARKRTFEHVEGNYATHVRARAGAATRATEKTLDAFVEAFGELEKVSDLKREDGAHVSLSRTFACVKGDWERLFGNLRRELRDMEAFEGVFDAMRVFTNDDGSRAFVAAGFREGSTSASKVALVRAIERVDKAIVPLGFPKYYDDPDPHVSLLWVAGASEERVEAMRRFAESTTVEWRVDVNRVLCDVSGQTPKTVWGRVPGLPAPDL